MLYAGIDLAWKRGNPSGIAVINDERAIIHCSAPLWPDSEISRFLTSLEDDFILSVDSPLQVLNETGGRPCDSDLMKHSFNGRFLKVFATSVDYMNRHYGGVRGADLFDILRMENGLKLGKTIVETFPTAVIQSLFPGISMRKYKITSALKLGELKENFLILKHALEEVGFYGDYPEIGELSSKKAYKEAEDRIDAILCAVNSYYFHRLKSFVQFGNGENGLTVIALPI
ncbi:DUF429 domain-containing protein [Spirochaeta isovalerica]|uniref:Putative RNase H-like nuclease n=1 Tax=Spirochaeta isovalerica TaxID=150 RepID=A0A841R646_9SPIO|nr:DUF429 domain-containing protein [Spirochaeta isovalerica]MBB6479325.1 putative RNase H-like nuclease [Spirochaeta isovalerica]